MTGAERINIRQIAQGAIIAVKVVSGSSRDRIAGALGECLKIAVAAPAERGRANSAAAAVLADALGLPRRNVALVAGQTAPRKEFLLAGATVETIRQALGGMKIG
jgi:hypothetical protein